MATPISAFFRAGASLTPSPVIATISLFFFKALTILSLSCGVTLAKTEISLIVLRSFKSLILLKVSPSTTKSPFL